MRTTLMATAVLVLAAGAACSAGDGNQGTRAPSVVETDELAALEAQLTAVETERDELADELAVRSEQDDRAAARHAASQATTDAIAAILADPDAFGSTEAEIVAALSEHATDTAVMDDDVFGAIDWTVGFSKTLFEGPIDARIDVYDTWLSDDGSQGGSLWVWYGTNLVGNPFELVGISLDRFDEDGKVAGEVVSYPYPDEYVETAISGAGTALTVTRPNRAFSFADDDLCDWITADDLTDMVATVYDWDGEVTPVRPDGFTCRWQLTGHDEVPPMIGMSTADLADAPVRQWEPSSEAALGEFVVGHPEMSDGAGYLIGGFGYFAVGVPDDGRYLELFVTMPEDTLVDAWDTHVIRLGDVILHDLGWVD